MDLSIIIVNWNTKYLLQKCLSSIVEYTQDIQYELIVVDNASEDGSVEMLKDKFKYIKIIKNSSNLGFAKSVNKGIAHAYGENILLLNSDAYIKNNAFYTMHTFLKKKPDIIAVSSKILYPDGRTQPALSYYPSLSGVLYDFIRIINLFPDHKIFDKLNVTKWNYQNSLLLTPDLMIGGCCFMIRKKGIDEIGFMDERFTPAYFEDADWCYRLKEKGLKMYYLAEAEVYHYHGYTCKNSYDKFKEYLTIATQKNRQYFFKKHYGIGKLLLLKLINILQNMLFVLYIALKICLKFRFNNKDLNRKLKLYTKLTLDSFTSV